MKIQLLLFSLISFTIPLFPMQFSPQQIKQNIVAARLHNRTQCPLARLPREVQDHISEYLEFNDRESDEEFARNSQKLTTIAEDYKLGTTQADTLLLDKLKPLGAKHAQILPEVKILYSRDKSKVLMTKNYNFSLTEKGCYFFIYDLLNGQTLFSKFIFDTSVAVLHIPLALSNDGKFCLLKHQPATDYHYELFSTEKAKTIAYHYNVAESFNKQSTKCIYHGAKCMNKEYPEDSQRTAGQKTSLYLLCSEQEHNERSKKTLSHFLHQKGICKPFYYTQVNS